MMSPLDTRIAFFGAAVSESALAAASALADAGYEVIACETDPLAVAALENAAIPAYGDRAAVLESAQVVFTCCPGAEAVEELYLGEDSLLELMEPGTVAIDLSVTRPQLAREIQAMGAISEINVIDCPVINLGDHEKPVAFVGGTPEAIEGVQPLLPYLATDLRVQSAPGEGQTAAIISIIAFAGALMGVVEAMSAARIAGMSDRAVLDILASTGAASRALVNYAPGIVNADFEGSLKVYAFFELLETALDAADDLEVTLPMTETAAQLCDLLSIVGGEELNIHALALLYEGEQTCADHGLDWARAEEASGYPFDPGDDDFDGMGFGGPMGGGPFGMGPMGFPSNGYTGGSDPHHPPIGGFFSKN